MNRTATLGIQEVFFFHRIFPYPKMIERRKVVDMLIKAQVEVLYANMISENNKGLEILFSGVIKSFRNELDKSNKLIQTHATLRRERVDEMFFLWYDIEDFFILVEEFTSISIDFIKTKVLVKGVLLDKKFVDRCRKIYQKIQKTGRSLMRVLEKLIEDMRDDPFLWKTRIALRQDWKDVDYCLKKLEGKEA